MSSTKTITKFGGRGASAARAASGTSSATNARLTEAMRWLMDVDYTNAEGRGGRCRAEKRSRAAPHDRPRAGFACPNVSNRPELLLLIVLRLRRLAAGFV